MKACDENECHTCMTELRKNPQKKKEKVYIGCGAGFGGDRISAAVKLLQRVEELDYLVLECLAERTLLERYQIMMDGGDGYDSRVSDWMTYILPLALEKGVCIITNMGAVDPLGAKDKTLEISKRLGIKATVAVAYEFGMEKSGASTYIGAAPIVDCLEKYKPDVVITSRVADASLFLAPLVYELGWNWNDYDKLAQGTLAGHLLECGCQLTGGFFMHPGDKYRSMPFQQLLDISLPFAEVNADGKVCVGKVAGSGGILNFSTCAEQLLYEVGDPGAYVTPDIVVDFGDVFFKPLSNNKVLCSGARPSTTPFPNKLLQLVPEDHGWKGWGEISYGGYGSVERANAAEFLVKSWVNEVIPGSANCIMSYIIGADSLKTADNSIHIPTGEELDIRFRMDGLFDYQEHASAFVKEFTALYTNGPAGGGGISTGKKKEMVLEKHMVARDRVWWRSVAEVGEGNTLAARNRYLPPNDDPDMSSSSVPIPVLTSSPTPAPWGCRISLYEVAHSRAGDKGNCLNFSVIPHFPGDVGRLRTVITPEWVGRVVSPLLRSSSFDGSEDERWVAVEVYEVKGIHALNVVVGDILDGGVNCSRRIDRHGKTISDLILCQQVILPPPLSEDS